MYALKRIAAYAIDMILVYTPLAAVIGYGESPFMGALSAHFQLFASLGAMAFAFGAPILLIGTLTGLTGRSPGKFVMFLNVKDCGGDPPGIAQGICGRSSKVCHWVSFSA